MRVLRYYEENVRQVLVREGIEAEDPLFHAPQVPPHGPQVQNTEEDDDENDEDIKKKFEGQ